MISIVIVDPNASTRKTVAEWIDSSPGHRCLGSCETGEEALRDAIKLRPDVVLLETSLPRMTGMVCAAQLKLDLPKLRVIMFTERKDQATIFQSLRAGACGYLLKGASREEILHAITEAESGGAPIAAEIVRHIVHAFQRVPFAAPVLPKVSPRERDVLQLLSRGMSTKQIANSLGISYETACVHLRRLYGKLKVRSRTEAVIKNLEAQSARLDPIAEIWGREADTRSLDAFDEHLSRLRPAVSG